ncbi:MAG: tyrosine-type recombinase/integrase [Proteobacteria bacterium]|nr:tyrosine-type recombinase/integrase [Pseudomonadota bacterium]MBU4472179.1 tyrosine-type recombinase/integrase [Pseudomonadota bacterium]MCG2750388.1 tyrosine-type recombinase/integrase [Desulfobacteraceae bacterium]
MLYHYLKPFLDYFKLAEFSNRSFQAMASRINEFQHYLQDQNIKSIKKIHYKNLVAFAGDFHNPSIHVTKSRVWMLRQFYHYLTLQRHVPNNIALKLPYPKIEKTVPDFLTSDELNRLIQYFAGQAHDLIGLRNLVIIVLLGFLGIRTSALIGINIEDVDVTSGLLWVYEKGRRHHTLILPHCVCKIVEKYLRVIRLKKGPLLITQKKKRISARTLQDVFKTAADCVGIDKRLHARLCRHTAATHLNKVAGIDITQHVLGHALQTNTVKYAHLNPDQYAVYMKQHPYMRKEPS